MRFEEVHNNRGALLLQAVSGSQAYGLATPQSDVDIKGVFVQPRGRFYGLRRVEQVANEKHDTVYYEVGRFVELLLKNNPTALEILATPEDCILHRHPLMQRIRPEAFLSRLCNDTFAGYAKTQIKKARGLNKKIFNPVEPKRRGVLDFCYALEGGHSIPVQEWLKKQGLNQQDCGLAAVPHARDVYALFGPEPSPGASFSGIVSGPEANDVSLSSIPKGAVPAVLVSFNKDGYSTHCRQYREYRGWEEDRNAARYAGTLSHGRAYDAKNMMHTFRLLHTAAEIAREGALHVRRPDRDFLLRVRAGEFPYEDLLQMADERLAEMDALYAASPLPKRPDEVVAEAVLVKIREEWYAPPGSL